MTCYKLAVTKYQYRPGPPYAAKDCQGKRRKGNDGFMYESVANVNGIYRWSKITPKRSSKPAPKKSAPKRSSKPASKKSAPKRSSKPAPKKLCKNPKKYDILDNGSAQYTVVVCTDVVSVLNKHNKLLFSVKPKAVLIGKSPFNKITAVNGTYGKEYDGNSILLKTAEHTYIYIGTEIYKFTAAKPIKTFVSLVDEHGVAYPYAIDTEKNIYLFLPRIIISGIGHVNPYIYYAKNPNVKHRKIIGVKTV